MAQQTVTAILCSLVALLNLTIVTSDVFTCPSLSSALNDLEPCLDSFEGSNRVPPSEQCCYVIRTMEPTCLCSAVGGYKNSANVNVRAALDLPMKCGRIVPVNFNCEGMPVPSAPVPPIHKLKY